MIEYLCVFELSVSLRLEDRKSSVKRAVDVPNPISASASPPVFVEGITTEALLSKAIPRVAPDPPR